MNSILKRINYIPGDKERTNLRVKRLRKNGFAQREILFEWFVSEVSDAWFSIREKQFYSIPKSLSLVI